MEAAGNGIAVAAEFPACMEDRQDDFDGRLADLMHGYRDTAAIVDDSDAVVFLDGYRRLRRPDDEGPVSMYCRCTSQAVCGRLPVLPILESVRHHI